jgi:hypothetical protein
MTFVSDGTPGFEHGIRFVGATGWAHVTRGALTVHDPGLLRDPQNKCGTMPVRLPASRDHARNFVEAIRQRTRAICDIETAVRSDTLCQLALIAVKRARRIEWDPKAERFVNDDTANAMLQARPFRGDWRLKEV